MLRPLGQELYQQLIFADIWHQHRENAQGGAEKTDPLQNEVQDGRNKPIPRIKGTSWCVCVYV